MEDNKKSLTRWGFKIFAATGIIAVILAAVTVGALLHGRQSEQQTEQQSGQQSEQQAEHETKQQESSNTANAYFFGTAPGQYEFQVKRLLFEGDETVQVAVEPIASYDDDSCAYTVDIIHDDCDGRYYYGVTDRFNIGKFLVTPKDIYLLQDYREEEPPTKEYFLEHGIQMNPWVNWETNIDGLLVKRFSRDDSWLISISNGLVESGFYAQYAWVYGEGLVYFRSGFGAEGDPIEIYRNGRDTVSFSSEGSDNSLHYMETPADCRLTEIDSMPGGSWQAEKSFPDQTGNVDKTLALNSMYSFDGFSGQGRLYLQVPESISGFKLFVNNCEIDTTGVTGGSYELDISGIAVNGTNTIQVSEVTAKEPDAKVTVRIPYPTVIAGTPQEVGIDERSLRLIDTIISSDVDNGFSSAQMAIVKDGKLVYQNSWGQLNSYNKDGSRLTGGAPVTDDTLYDLASNTKMYSAAYALQYLADRGDISFDTRVVDVLGQEFADDTIEIRYASFKGEYPGLDTIKRWKSSITVKDLLMHRAGFPDSGHYHNDKFDAAAQKLDYNVDNVLYVADADKEKTFREGICRTPLMNEPGTVTRYSDIDYMILGLMIEKITGKDLNTFLRETYWEPMGLEHITYCPTDNGFAAGDCAATELNGNTRDGVISFPGVRTETIQGEAHDEEAYYTMEGMSGHAGLFANATDLAKLASVMLTGGYGENRFFSKDTRDFFIAPQAGGAANYGIGWWREGDDKRVWYFGTQSPESTVGHQGWTGTLTMIDFENNMVMVLLTNAVNTPIWNPAMALEGANQFSGKYYTTGTLGFAPQILYTGLDSTGDPYPALKALLEDMKEGKKKLADEAAKDNGGSLPEDHPMTKALKAITEAELY